jgi:hypothetical protein
MSLPVGCCAATVAYASGACSCALDVFAAASIFQGSGALAGGCFRTCALYQSDKISHIDIEDHYLDTAVISYIISPCLLSIPG